MIGSNAAALCATLNLWLAQNDASMQVVAEGSKSNFQPYIFWAYGLACLLLLGFSAWTVMQVRGLDERLHHLKGRFEDSRSSE